MTSSFIAEIGGKNRLGVVVVLRWPDFVITAYEKCKRLSLSFFEDFYFYFYIHLLELYIFFSNRSNSILYYTI